MLIDFLSSFSGIVGSKFVISSLLKIQPHLKVSLSYFQCYARYFKTIFQKYKINIGLLEKNNNLLLTCYYKFN